MADEAEPLDQPWLLTARCKSCLYPLRDLSAPRCPECGRTFDPFDPHTMNAPGWYLTKPYTRRALCRHCGYALCGLTTQRCPECATSFNADDPRTMRIPGYKPPREPRPPASFGQTMITLAAGAMVISFFSAYSRAGLMTLYGLALWCVALIAWAQRSAALRRSRRRGIPFTGSPDGPRWRTVTAILLALTMVLCVSYERCPHALYIGWGDMPLAVWGKACNNQRFPKPVVSLLWSRR